MGVSHFTDETKERQIHCDDDIRSARNNPDPKVGEVRRQLDEWVAATNNSDLSGQINFYAPVVERFYLRRNYRRSSVERDKERLMSRSRLLDVTIEDPKINFSPDGRTAIMRFRKSYRLDGTQQRNAVLQELKWRLIDGEWLIVSERDLRVLS